MPNNYDDNDTLSKLLALDNLPEDGNLEELLENLTDKDLSDLIDLDRLEKLERDFNKADSDHSLDNQLQSPSPPSPQPKARKRKHSSPPVSITKEKGKKVKKSVPHIVIKKEKLSIQAKKQSPFITKEKKPSTKNEEIDYPLYKEGLKSPNTDNAIHKNNNKTDSHKNEEIYCICRKPMGNKFMIGCDSCDEWFHGSCVGITAEQGRQMEKSGEDYTCSKCAQNKRADNVILSNELKDDKYPKPKKVATVAPMKHYSPDVKYTRYEYDDVERSSSKCKISGCQQFSMKNSPFCSQQCVLKFAQDSMKGDSKEAILKPKTPLDKEIPDDRKLSQHNHLRKGIRKHLKHFLSERAKEVVDLVITNDEITKTVQHIEMALFKLFPDCGYRYKAKIKTIFFNIKDPKNDNLYHNILSGTLSADKLVRMSSEEMSMRIKTKSVESVAPATATATSTVTPVTSTADNVVNVMDMLEDTTTQHGTHVFDVKCRKCTGKTVKKKEPEKPKEEKNIAEHVPNRLALSAKPLKDPLGLNPALWDGYITMTSLTKFSTSGYHVYGPQNSMSTILPETLHVQGRIANNIIWAYVDRLRNSPLKELVILKFESQIPEEVQGYSNLFHYLSSRSRCGVIGNVTTPVRDMYLVPLSAEGSIPPQLRLLGVSSIPKKNRTNLILGLIVINKTLPNVKQGALDIPYEPVPEKKEIMTQSKSANYDREAARAAAREARRNQQPDTNFEHLSTFPNDIDMMPFEYSGGPSKLHSDDSDSIEITP